MMQAHAQTEKEYFMDSNVTIFEGTVDKAEHASLNIGYPKLSTDAVQWP